ncbi:DUF3040 domain-containing protein [Actinomycetospora sp. CA-084318]|uniref:DUF3040 domain-containing protein n=1 Tax=Actinomycetospora sp. CA-084318 TaxID=3239892 RepID=UPI003D988685
MRREEAEALTADELRRLDHLARGVRLDDPGFAALLTADRHGRRRRRVPVLGVVLAAVVLAGAGAGIVLVAVGRAGAGPVPVVLGAASIGLCFAAVTRLTAAPRDQVRTARRAARAPSVCSRSRWRR